MNNPWIDKIKELEVSPPERGWDRIAASLDESFTGHEFPVKIYNAEIPPPATAWDKIREMLPGDSHPGVPVTPGKIRWLFMRYAIAASLLGIVAYAAFQYFSVRPGRGDVAVDKQAAPLPEPTAADSGSRTVVQAPVTTDSARDGQALEESKHTYAKLDLPVHAFSNKLSASLYSSPAELSSSLPAETGLEKNPELQYPHRAAVSDLQEEKDANRYLMFKDSEGRFIKISKKLTSLYCCVSGEEQDENCNDQLRKWREKIASSSFIPSPDNFMDILDLVSSLQDRN